jgi:HEAT repeat protein
MSYRCVLCQQVFATRRSKGGPVGICNACKSPSVVRPAKERLRIRSAGWRVAAALLVSAAAGLAWWAAVAAQAPGVNTPVVVAEATAPETTVLTGDGQPSASDDSPATRPAACPDPRPVAVADGPADDSTVRVATAKDAGEPMPPAPDRPAPEPAAERTRADTDAKDSLPKQPAPAAAPAKPADPDRRALAAAIEIKRFDTSTEEELRKELVAVPELALDRLPNTSRQLRALVAELGNRPYPGPAGLLGARVDLQGLPFLQGEECHLGKGPAENLQALSVTLHKQVQECTPKSNSADLRLDVSRLRGLLSQDAKAKQQWCSPDAVPTLLQVMQAENAPARLLMVELLSEVDDPRTTCALAVRAMVDLAPEVRTAAVRALASRPAADFRDLLLAGLRHPWPPVAAHAAEALAALRDKGAVAALVALLDRPAPGLPTASAAAGQFPVVREMVRVNHLRNCMLCHPPSVNTTDLVRGAVPSPSKPLIVDSITQYYDTSNIFVHADVTYLRQDFSVMQPAEQPPTGWPAHQRFDYMVRTRKISPTDAKPLSEAKGRLSREYRATVLFALAAITGVDAGGEVVDWRAVQTAANIAPAAKSPPPGAAREWKQFLSAEAPADTAAGRGAHPWPVLSEKREATASQLAALSAGKLRERLYDDAAEVRANAARAAALKGERSLTLDLIFLLDDQDSSVVQQARAALHALTGRDSGPDPEADRSEQRRSVADWLDWWKTTSARAKKAAI